MQSLVMRNVQVAAAKAYDRFARKLYVALELQAGNADPEPSRADTNFNLDGTRYASGMPIVCTPSLKANGAGNIFVCVVAYLSFEACIPGVHRVLFRW